MPESKRIVVEYTDQDPDTPYLGPKMRLELGELHDPEEICKILRHALRAAESLCRVPEIHVTTAEYDEKAARGPEKGESCDGLTE